jgi:hypothetical protein
MATDRTKTQVFFENLSYPASQGEVRKFASEHGVDSELREKLRRIESKSYGTPKEIADAVERIREVSGPKPRSII